MQQVEDDVLLHSKQCDAKQCEHQKLDWADFPQQRPVGDQAPGHTEVCVDQADWTK